MDENRRTCGKVWLVGAGPGDIGLLTLKGLQVLRDADVIVYDHLVGRSLLTVIGEHGRMINVGKEAGHHPVAQERINQILVEEAEKGQSVVRLKGGDPFLFGRGGEELQVLRDRGIPYEVVPGVTSSLAVPAYQGIPVTHREYASSVHIITAHRKKGGETGLDYHALAQLNGTLVFLMGVTALEDIQAGLLEAGMSPDMPAAVLQEGTTARQRKAAAPLKEIEREAKQAGIEPPAIIIVGEVCRLCGRLSWYEELPLSGMRILVTRPREHVSETADRLRRKGAEVLEVPAIATVPYMQQPGIRKALEQLEDYSWIVFTSQVGVRIFFEEMAENDVDVRRLSGVHLAVIGEGTRKALRERGILADLMPEVYEGEALAEALIRQGIRGKKILIPRAAKGNQMLVPMLEGAGAYVEDLPIYETVYRECQSIDLKEEFAGGRIDCVVFTSASTVDGFAAVTGGIDYKKVKAACIGRQTQERARQYGMQCYVAEKATIDSLVELTERIKEDEKETQKIKRM